MIQYRPEIDGLRALAIVPVVLLHAGFGAVPGGFLGVDIFFVISGFLITGIILEETDRGEFSLRRFYARRARRLLPALLFVLLVTSLCAFAWMMPAQLVSYAQSALASLVFVANIYFWLTIDYFSPGAQDIPLLHLWSLGVEEQFYLIFPLLLMLMAGVSRARKFAWLFGLLAVSLIACEIGWREWPRATFYLIPFRAWELLAGACLALAGGQLEPLKARFGGTFALIGLGLILVSVFAFDASLPMPSVYGVAPVLGTVLVLAFASQHNACGKLLSLAPIRFVGLISFSAYLWHQPVIAFAKIQPFAALPYERSLTVLVSFALAAITWYAVEQPFRTRRSLAKPLRWVGAGALVVSTLLGLIWLTAAMIPHKTPAYAQGVRDAGPEIVEYADDLRRKFECNQSLISDPWIRTCRFGVLKARPDVVVWGDSLGSALVKGFDDTARERGLSGVAFVVPGCPPVVGLERKSLARCHREVHRQVLGHILALPGDAPVILVGNLAPSKGMASQMHVDGEPATADGLKRNVALMHDELSQGGKRLAVLEPGPNFPKEVARFHLMNARRGLEADLSVARAAQERRVSLARDLGSAADVYIPTIDFFCDAQRCPSRDEEGRLVIFDRLHITRLYGAKLSAYTLDTLFRQEKASEPPETLD